ncbi:hypothetical protein GM3708_760 [Geminocystis sp. NIES-3708]|uniref:hypothetical protein n=1 Tax=Geminocystis sp. NIES-3708 TaxID=1615909 RepID=UPI0005FC87C4|nr:hypothetical protein [Geminocystis sp. NIES-3708]BAQ60354.1 hypothetical protein GM3708_760 [Geminocystis sp. NIES-3708]
MKINPRTFKFIIYIVSVALFIIFIQLGIPKSTNNYQKSIPLKEIPSQAQQVETGIYIINLYDLNASSNTYYADFYVWFKWKGKINPIENLELSNGVEDWGTTLVPVYEQIQKLPDGSFYQALRIEGRFTQPLSFENYPLDREKLDILLENSVYTLEQLVYVADQKQSGYSDSLNLPGWKIEDFELLSLVRQYQTNFGDTRFTDSTKNSILQYSLNISRPVSFFLWKLFLPLVIVIATGWGALLLNPENIDSRITLPVTALLTAVFLQQSYSASLPEVGYLVLLDKIYVITYILIFISIIEAIITAEWVKEDNPENYSRITQLDHLLLGFQIFTFGLTILVLIWISYVS